MMAQSRFLRHISFIILAAKSSYKCAESNCPLDYEFQDSKGKGRQDSPSSAEFSRYEQFLRSELPSRVRQELIREIEKELDPVEEKLKSKLPEIVRLVHKTLFEMYQGSKSDEQRSNNLGPADVPSQHLSENYDDHHIIDPFGWEIAAADDHLAPFFPTPFTDFIKSLDTNDMLLEPAIFSNLSTDLDSGYYSITGNPIVDCEPLSNWSKQKEQNNG